MEIIRKRHVVDVGDELFVHGELFVVSELIIKLQEPAVLITKQPIEIIREAENK
jgi:hypothetical protein